MKSVGLNSGPYKPMSMKLTTELQLEYLNFQLRTQLRKSQI